MERRLLKEYNGAMTAHIPGTAAKTADAEWTRIVAPYKRVRTFAALNHLWQGLTILAATWMLMYAFLKIPYGIFAALLLSPLAGGVLVKLFAIQHDCGHGALFSQKWANTLVGRALSPLVMTPYLQWSHEHAKHHATSGNLKYRGIGDVDMWTVREYLDASPGNRLRYRIYRHPLFLFGLGATGYFLFKQRMVWYQRDRLDSWISVWSTNAGMAGFIALISYFIGLKTFLVIWLPSIAFASGFGTWIFYIGHQFEDGYWENDETWDFFTASMKGASYYKVGRIIDYFTCNIGYHHIHHLCARIPFYNLPKCLEENEIFQIQPLGIWESLKCATLALWDEENKKMIRFKDLATAP